MKRMFAVPVLVVAAGLAVPAYGFGQQQQPQQSDQNQQAQPSQGSAAQIVGTARTVRGEVTGLHQRQRPGGGTSLLADLRTNSGQIVSVDLGRPDQISPNLQPAQGAWLTARGTLVKVNNWYYLFPDHASDVARITPAAPGQPTPAGAQLPANPSGSQ